MTTDKFPGDVVDQKVTTCCVPPVGLIHTLLPQAQAAIRPVAKDQENQFQHYNFRGIDGALKEASRVLHPLGISVSARVTSVDITSTEYEKFSRGKPDGKGTVTRCSLLMEVTFWAPDGSSRINILAGEATDFADKATNKAMSAAFKYGLFFG
ncbi:MAG TPA: ERF family protein, partial [Pirellulales bacterium]|nr:ERF family protein [Pirellulales bacterium]